MLAGLHPAPIAVEPATLPQNPIKAVRGLRWLVLAPLALLLKLWGMSLRFDVSALSLQHLDYREKPIAFVLWHNRLFLSAEIIRRYRKGRPAHALVSASKDGAWLDAFFSLVNIQTVRGSSSRLGREAAHSLIEVLRRGDDIGLTPDGPRGPMYEFKPGGLIVAKRAKAPLLLLGGSFNSAWQFGSWDRFYLPLPFSRVRVTCDFVPCVTFADVGLGAQSLERRLLEMNPDGPDE